MSRLRIVDRIYALAEMSSRFTRVALRARMPDVSNGIRSPVAETQPEQ